MRIGWTIWQMAKELCRESKSCQGDRWDQVSPDEFELIGWENGLCSMQEIIVVWLTISAARRGGRPHGVRLARHDLCYKPTTPADDACSTSVIHSIDPWTHIRIVRVLSLASFWRRHLRCLFWISCFCLTIRCTHACQVAHRATG